MDIPFDLRDECGDVVEADVVEVMAGLLFHRDYSPRRGGPTGESSERDDVRPS